MLNIISKDIYQNRKLIMTYFTIIMISFIVMNLISDGDGLESVGLMSMMVPFGLAIKSEIYEQKNKGYRLIKTLSLSNTKIVLSKFLTSIIMAIITAVFTLVVTILVSGDINIIKLALPFVTTAMLISLITAGVCYIISYKFGAEKANTFIIVLIGTLVFLGQITLFLARSYGHKKPVILKIIDSVIHFLKYTNGYLLILLGVSIYFITFLMSIRAFKNSKVI